MKTVLQYLSESKEHGIPIDEIILELKNRNIDPTVSFRLLQMVFQAKHTSLEQRIIELYDLRNGELDVSNPFNDDFFKAISL